VTEIRNHFIYDILKVRLKQVKPVIARMVLADLRRRADDEYIITEQKLKELLESNALVIVARDLLGLEIDPAMHFDRDMSFFETHFPRPGSNEKYYSAP
jgi:hypothetical protein